MPKKRCKIMRSGKSILCLVSALVLCEVPVSIPAQPASEGKDICYLVIDRSSSIAKSGLVKMIGGAVVEFVGKLPTNACVEMVLFDTTADAPKRWEKMGLAEK